MRFCAWLVAWYAGLQVVLHFTHTPGMALIGLVLLTGFYSLVQLAFVLLGWVGR